MIVRLYEENVLDINKYLRSDELVRSLDKTDPYSCCQDVVSRCKTRFRGLMMPEVWRVQVCKILDNKAYDVINPDYYVVKFNNTFYDYCAKELYSDVFVIYSVPVIQQVLNAPELIHSIVSSVKDYVLITNNTIPDTEDDAELDIDVEESIKF